MQTIEHLFGGQAAHNGARIIKLVIAVGVVGFAGNLVGVRGGDGADEVSEIVAVLDRIRRQRLDQRGMRGRIRGAEIINGIHKAAAQEVVPNAVHERAGEEGVVRPRDPVGERFEFGAGVRGRGGDAQRRAAADFSVRGLVTFGRG